MKALCVFCGSSLGFEPVHGRFARKLGERLAVRGVQLVFGGGSIGLMGALADSVLSNGGVATGVIPEFLMKPEIAHPDLTEMIVVKDMHARKRRMFELADGFAVLPGGLGTLDEAVEVITWRQLQLHDKPIALLDNDGYWAWFPTAINHFVVGGFASEETKKLFTILRDVDEVIDIVDLGGG
ncbi:uncharacterized protein METZ01_LOCUS277602 [marine metagenome]|uniref:Cytokinin riboside 5'-monophosphate phosphoribohydrolase n=1 Tax=marine metagenome TaxID=408172 RepID=A0A382KJX3_9ZZZZ